MVSYHASSPIEKYVLWLNSVIITMRTISFFKGNKAASKDETKSPDIQMHFNYSLLNIKSIIAYNILQLVIF